MIIQRKEKASGDSGHCAAAKTGETEITVIDLDMEDPETEEESLKEEKQEPQTQEEGSPADDRKEAQMDDNKEVQTDDSEKGQIDDSKEAQRQEKGKKI